ncbi:MAG: ABC-type sugar transport system ATPase subunit [Pirellulaceae bacterium]|jgi:ABC-type sugar transport system ATPase subunit
MESQEDTAPMLVSMIGLSKSYGGVNALVDVGFNIGRAEIHALCGENGAGKSTLIKCLSGVVVPAGGSIEFGSGPLPFGDVRAAEDIGIAVIHQESTTFPDLNTVQNIFVGRELTMWGGWVLDHSAMLRETKRLMERLGQDLNIDVPVGMLSVAQRQMVSIARALSHDCKLMVMDEPTASLSDRETAILLDLVRQLRDDGVSVLYVSHRLEEILELSQRVTVLRDGRWVDTAATSTLGRDQLIELMIGTEKHDSTKRAASSNAKIQNDENESEAAVCLRVERLTRVGKFEDISFDVKRGEIVGIAGLVGAGRTEVAHAVFGIDDYDSGRVEIDGQTLQSGSVRGAIRLGIALVPEDRQHQGLVLPMTAKENLSLTVLNSLSTCSWIDVAAEQKLVDGLISSLDIRTPHRDLRAAMLSGGNQQKLVIGKWLARKPKLLILDEPTRGVDVGGKHQVHQRILELAKTGTAALVISSDLPELIELCDRIYVMCEGRIAGELSGSDIASKKILELAFPQRGTACAPSGGTA